MTPSSIGPSTGRRARRSLLGVLAVGSALLLPLSPVEAQAPPPGHPPVGQPAGSGDVLSGLRRPLPNRSSPDPTVPAGTVEVEVRDEQGKPLSGIVVGLSTMVASIAQGNSESVQKKTTDSEGVARFSGLDSSIRHNYGIEVTRDGAEYFLPPFRLAERGHRAIVHTYPVTSDLRDAFVGIQALASITLRSGQFQVQAMYRVMPLAQKTYRPRDVTIRLPAGAQGIEVAESPGPGRLELHGESLKLAGTYPPGQNEVSLTFHLDRENREAQIIDFGLPPHVTNMVVLVEKIPGMNLSIPGFDIQETQNQDGQMMFVARRTMEPGQAPLSHLPVEIRGLPVVGPGRWYAASLALVLSLSGLGFAFSRRTDKTGESERDRREAREVLLGEMTLLEKAYQAEEIGPRTYEQTKREILLALSRLDAQTPA